VLDGRSAPIELKAHRGASVCVGCGALVEGGASIEAQDEITIGSGARIGRFVKILDSHFHPLRRDGSPPPPPLAVTVGPGAVVETGAVVLRGGHIESGAHVLPGAVVSRRVPAGVRFPASPGSGGRELRSWTARPPAPPQMPASEEPTSRVAVLAALLRGWVLFRRCRKGVRNRAHGYVRVVPNGEIALGDRTSFLGGMVPTELVAHEGGVLSVGSSTVVNYGSSFEAWRSVRIGTRCWIASFVRITDRGWQGTLPVTIGDDVWIAHGVTLEPGVSVGSGSVIAAGSVVTEDVPPHSLAVGNPARCVGLDLVAPAPDADRVLVHG
jgi:maltose O-acetyltransferase